MACTDDDLTNDELVECSHGFSRIKELEAKMAKDNTWPTIKLHEFLDRTNSEYERQWDAFRSVKLKTLGVFLNRDVEEVKQTFTRQGTRLPKVFEILHREYWGRE
jgi:predicted transcriptional regulator